MALDLKDLDKFKKQRFKPLVDSSAPVAPKVMKMPWESFTASPETASDEIQRGTTLPSKGNNDQIKGELGALQMGTKGNNKGEQRGTLKGNSPPR